MPEMRLHSAIIAVADNHICSKQNTLISNHRSILHSFFRCPDPILSGMYDSGEQLLHPEEIQRRFKKVFGRDMNRTERDIFFLPVEPPLEQEDED
jgi:hypothetical protein